MSFDRYIGRREKRGKCEREKRGKFERRKGEIQKTEGKLNLRVK
jgi:hypothetical protein